MTRAKVWTAAGALWVALLAWGLASPVLSSPDENVHLALLYCEAGLAQCDQPTAVRTTPCFAQQPQIPADCLPEEIQVPVAGVESGRYPVLYTQLLSPIVTESVKATVLRVRMVNSTLAVLAILLALWASAPGLRRPVALAWTATLVPLGMFLVPSLNSSSWTIIGAAALLGPLLSIVSDGVSGRRLVAVAVSTAMILGSRNEGWVVVAIASLVALAWGLPLRRAAWVPGGLLALSGLTALLRDNPALEPSASVGYRGPWEQFLLWMTTPADVVGAQAAFPAPLGWLDTPVPRAAGLLAFATLAGLVWVGIGVMDMRKLRAAVLCVVTTGAVAWLGWVSQYPSAFQPRYGLPLMVLVLGVLLLPTARHSVDLTRAQELALATSLGIANSLALLSLSIRFTLGGSAETTIEPSPPFAGPLQLLSAGRMGWSLTPVTPFLAWTIGTVAFGVYVVLVAVGSRGVGSQVSASQTAA